MKLTQILAIALLISSVYSAIPAWNQETDSQQKGANEVVLTEGDLAKKFWMYSNSAYCAQKKVDDQSCDPCQFTQPNVQGEKRELPESWIHEGAIVYVQYDKLINKVVVTFRSTISKADKANEEKQTKINEAKPKKTEVKVAKAEKGTKNKKKKEKAGPKKAGYRLNKKRLNKKRIQKEETGPTETVNKKQETIPTETVNKKQVTGPTDTETNEVVTAQEGTQKKVTNQAIKDWNNKKEIVSIVTQCTPSEQTPSEQTEKIKKHRLSKKHHKNKGVDQKSGVTASNQNDKDATGATELSFTKNDEKFHNFDGKECYVNKGFQQNTHGLMQVDGVNYYISKLYKQNGADGLAFTGHSLGGAMATIAASSFLENQIQDIKNGVEKKDMLNVSSLYTYGSPQVGDQHFQSWFDQETKKLKISSLRFVYNNDIVTKRMGYKHVGKLIRFNSQSKIYSDCGINIESDDKQGDDNEECDKDLSKSSYGNNNGWFFKSEKLITENKYCDMTVDQVEDAVYQKKKSEKRAETEKNGKTPEIANAVETNVQPEKKTDTPKEEKKDTSKEENKDASKEENKDASKEENKDASKEKLKPVMNLRHRLSRKHRKVQKNY